MARIYQGPIPPEAEFTGKHAKQLRSDLGMPPIRRSIVHEYPADWAGAEHPTEQQDQPTPIRNAEKYMPDVQPSHVRVGSRPGLDPRSFGEAFRAAFAPETDATGPESERLIATHSVFSGGTPNSADTTPKANSTPDLQRQVTMGHHAGNVRSGHTVPRVGDIASLEELFQNNPVDNIKIKHTPKTNNTHRLSAAAGYVKAIPKRVINAAKTRPVTSLTVVALAASASYVGVQDRTPIEEVAEINDNSPAQSLGLLDAIKARTVGIDDQEMELRIGEAIIGTCTEGAASAIANVAIEDFTWVDVTPEGVEYAAESLGTPDDPAVTLDAQTQSGLCLADNNQQAVEVTKKTPLIGNGSDTYVISVELPNYVMRTTVDWGEGALPRPEEPAADASEEDRLFIERMTAFSENAVNHTTVLDAIAKYINARASDELSSEAEESIIGAEMRQTIQVLGAEVIGNFYNDPEFNPDNVSVVFRGALDTSNDGRFDFQNLAVAEISRPIVTLSDNEAQGESTE